MSTPTPEDREALQREIQAAIAAGRDLDPEMDQHLADSAVDRYHQEKAARDRALSRHNQQTKVAPRPPNSNVELVVQSVVQGIMRIVVLGGLIALIVASIAFKFVVPVPVWVGFVFLFLMMRGGRRWSGRRRYSYDNGPSSVSHIEDDFHRQEREARRKEKIAHLESKLTQLKRDDYV